MRGLNLARKPVASPASPPASAAEINEALSRENFQRVAAFIESYSGIKMPPTKRTMIESRMRRLVRDRGFTSLNAYCRHLFEEGGLEQETVALIDMATTNKTEFFREPAHFDILRASILPELTAAGRRALKIWSAACSTGAELYTLAMVLEEYCLEARGVSYSILGTDICTQVLSAAVAGVYAKQMIEPVPEQLRRRYVLTPRDPKRDVVRISPELRAKVAVARLNLMDERYPVDRDMDVIFCRNILIYFDKATQARVLSRLCQHLRPGGFLFLGHSEVLVGVDLPLDQAAATVFRRR